jgi:very-short-patch-repair endonuclease
MTARWSLDQLNPAMRRQAKAKLASLSTLSVSRPRLVQPLGPMPEEETPAQAAARDAREIAEAAKRKLVWLLGTVGLPEPVSEHAFHETRGWRFDLAYVDPRIGIEIEGGVYEGNRGRHMRTKGFLEDINKYNEAAIAGWRLIRVTHAMIHNGKAVQLIERVYG